MWIGVQSGLMVCGVDTYHEGAQKSNSVVGFVASVNESCTRWYSRVAIQQRGEELINGLKLCFLSSIRQYHEVQIHKNIYYYLCNVTFCYSFNILNGTAVLSVFIHVFPFDTVYRYVEYCARQLQNTYSSEWKY